MKLTLIFIFSKDWSIDGTVEPKWYFEDSKRGGKLLIINGYPFYRYGAGVKTRWLCRAYRQHG